MSDIKIREVVSDKKSNFNVKRFDLKHASKDFNIKTVDVNSMTGDLLDAHKELRTDSVIFEKGKTVRAFTELTDVASESNTQKVKQFFGHQRALKDKPSLLHFTLRFNPYNYVDRISDLDGFFQYYYAFSRSALMVPNVVKSVTPYTEDQKVKQEVQIIDFEDYSKFVKETADLLNTKNNKPIFVPISLKFSIQQIKELVQTYVKDERFYYWVDFEAKPIEAISEAKLRLINDVLRDKGVFDKSLLFLTNLRREIVSHMKDDNSPASDVLGTLCGANLVGINKEPMRPVKKTNKTTETVREHKARIFDSSTYYYKKLGATGMTREANVTKNALLLAGEFNKQREYFLKERDIKDYIQTKKMLQEHENGRFLSQLFPSKTKQLTLF